jgi:multiple sugar transport system permease protein/putative aldouronate transport system permease protein
MRERKIKYGRADSIFTIVSYALLAFAFLIVIYPLIYIVSASFSSPYAVMSGRVFLFPVEPTLNGYRAVFNSRQIWTGYANSAFYTIFGTSINIVMTILAAYPLSRKDFYGRNLIMAIFTFTMFFSGGLIPYYLLIRSLGILNTRWAMLIPGAMSVWNVIIARTFFQSNIPIELLDAAQIDGCNNIRFILKIVIPLSGPIIAVMTLWYAVGHWNSYFNALIFLKSAKLYPLQIILRNILIQNEISSDMLGAVDIKKIAEMEGLRELLKYSLIIVASVPVLLIYPFVQKYFVRGIMIGAIKG